MAEEVLPFNSSPFNHTYPYVPGFSPDSDLRQWLLSGQRDQLAIRRKLHGFIFSVLAITEKHLEGLENKMFSEMTHNRCRICANLRCCSRWPISRRVG